MYLSIFYLLFISHAHHVDTWPHVMASYQLHPPSKASTWTYTIKFLITSNNLAHPLPHSMVMPHLWQAHTNYILWLHGLKLNLSMQANVNTWLHFAKHVLHCKPPHSSIPFHTTIQGPDHALHWIHILSR